MSNNERDNSIKEAVKVIIFLLLSYIIPIFGVGFSIYILSNTKLRNYGNWVSVLSVIALIIQLLSIGLMLLGYLMWFNA